MTEENLERGGGSGRKIGSRRMEEGCGGGGKGWGGERKELGLGSGWELEEQ